MPQAFSSSFLTLIPKNGLPSGLDDYSLICLVECVHKILSNLLAFRLKRVLGHLILSCQSAFVSGRQLLDGVLAANGVVYFTTRTNNDSLLFKVNFEKTYNKVSWEFLWYMMKRMNFWIKWLEWMKAIVFSSHISILGNGVPTKDFEAHRGLR